MLRAKRSPTVPCASSAAGGRSWQRVAAATVLLIGPILWLIPALLVPAQAHTDAPQPVEARSFPAGVPAEPAPAAAVEIRSSSGTPPLLEITVSTTTAKLHRVTVVTQDTSFSTDFRDGAAVFEAEVKLAPFREPGIHDMQVIAHTSEGFVIRNYRVGFSDFVWGRDNFRFANASRTPKAIDAYSESILPWAEDRFRELSTVERNVLINAAYSVLRNRIGRCYAFAGGKARYHRYPEFLPDFYDSVYDIPATRRDVLEEMNNLQNDMMFDYIVASGHDFTGEQKRSELATHVHRVMEEVGEGRLGVFGYLAPERHHALAAYGFIQDMTGERVLLLAANNWGDEHDVNIHSEAAENIAIDLAPDHKGPRVRWLDTDHSVYEYAELLLAVDVQRDYEHDPAHLQAVLRGYAERIAADGANLLVVERADEARLKDKEGNTSGRAGWRVKRELEGVEYTEAGETHIFAIRTDAELELVVVPVEPENDDPSNGEDEVPAVSYAFYLTGAFTRAERTGGDSLSEADVEGASDITIGSAGGSVAPADFTGYETVVEFESAEDERRFVIAPNRFVPVSLAAEHNAEQQAFLTAVQGRTTTTSR